MQPGGVGLGLRKALARALGEGCPSVSWLEFSPENYLGRGGWYARSLARCTERYPMVTHGLTGALGDTDAMDDGYLRALRAFCDEHGVAWHSEHLCWSTVDGVRTHDLLPLPRTKAVADHAAERLARTQDALGIPVALENITWYAPIGTTEMSEGEFITRVLERSDGRLLLDVNNVYVNAMNHGGDPRAFITSLPLDRVVEIHIAGHEVRPDGRRVDTHGEAIIDPVYELLAFTLAHTGDVPVLLERDEAIPDLGVLLDEIAHIEALRAGVFGEGP